MARSIAIAAGYFLAGAAANLVQACSRVPSRHARRVRKGFGKVPTRYASLQRRLDVLAEPFMPALVEKRSRLLTVGASGELQGEAWAMELGQFITESVLPRLGPDRAFAHRRLLYVAGFLDNRISEAAP